MKAFTPEFYDQLSNVIEDVEDSTTVEIVVAASPSSGTYREGPFILAFLFTMGALAYMLFASSAYFPDYAIIPELVAVFIGGFFGFNFFITFKRLFSRKSTRLTHAKNAASAYFTQAGMMNTRERTGMLIYLSFLEKEAIILPDAGVVNKLPEKELDKIKANFQKVFNASDVAQTILDGVRDMETPLNEHLPPGEDNPDELSNAFMMIK